MPPQKAKAKSNASPVVFALAGTVLIALFVAVKQVQNTSYIGPACFLLLIAGMSMWAVALLKLRHANS